MEWVFKLFKELKISSIIHLLKFKKPPIIICGCGRSGTTLLMSILSAHPKIYCIEHETTVLSRKRPFKNILLNRIWLNLRIINQLIRFKIDKDSYRWCEKTPSNVRYLQDLLLEFPNAHFIHIIRDGRDVCTSIHPSNKKYYFISIDKWVEDVKAGLSCSPNKRLLEIRYESLIRDFENTINNILSFIGEESSPQIYEFHKYSKVKKHLAWEGDLKPIYNSSLCRWKENAHNKRIEEFYRHSEALALLKSLGYNEIV